MHSLRVGLLGGAIGLLSALAFIFSGDDFFEPHALWLLPGVLFGCSLVYLHGKTRWWRYVLTLLLCSLGYPLAFLAGFGTMLLALGFEAAWIFLLMPLAFAVAGAIGGLVIVCAWSVLKRHGSKQIVWRSIVVGSVLAQAGFLSVFLYFIPFAWYYSLLTVWCAGMLILVNSWTTDLQPQQIQP